MHLARHVQLPEGSEEAPSGALLFIRVQEVSILLAGQRVTCHILSIAHAVGGIIFFVIAAKMRDIEASRRDQTWIGTLLKLST